jgi:hypothetical protein
MAITTAKSPSDGSAKPTITPSVRAGVLAHRLDPIASPVPAKVAGRPAFCLMFLPNAAISTLGRHRCPIQGQSVGPRQAAMGLARGAAWARLRGSSKPRP